MNALCAMDPGKVMKGLASCDPPLFKRDHLEEIRHNKTTDQKNMKLVETLMYRDFKGLSEFLRTLTSIDHAHYKLSLELQPLKHRIGWFAPSPAHAAAVVYVLEEYADAKFSRMERGGGDNKSLVIRRARIFPDEFTPEEKERSEVPIDAMERVKWSHTTEVCLVFPASNIDSMTALEKFLEDKKLTSELDLILTSVVEVKGQGSREKGGEAVLAEEVLCDTGRVSSGVEKAKKLESLKTYLNTFSPHGPEHWLEREKEIIGTKPDISFNTLEQCSSEISDSNSTDDASANTSSTILVRDPIAYRFYELCGAKCPGKASLLCYSAVRREEEGALATVSLRAESRAAVTSSCVLMEVCRHFTVHES